MEGVGGTAEHTRNSEFTHTCANTVSADPVSNKDFARMEMYTKTLQNKLDERSKVIQGLKIAAQKREYAGQKNAVPAQLKTPRSAESTNNIIESYGRF